MINRGDLGGMSRQTGITEQFFSSRLGNTAQLRWAGANPIVTSVPTPPNEDVLLLEADLSGTQNRDEWSAGSWVLTLDDQASFSGGPAGPSDPNRMICPTVARVTIGTGGAAQTFDVDTRNNSFQLPAANVSVRVGWDRTLPELYGGAPGMGYWLPDVVRIVGTLQRGFSAGTAKRTILLPQWVGGATQNSPRFRVPNFARCFRLWSPRTAAFFTSPSGIVNFYGEDEAQPYQLAAPLMTYPAANLVNPSGVPVPARAQSWQLLPAGVSPGFQLWGAEFDLTL